MNTINFDDQQTKNAVELYTIDCTDDLPSGASVSAAASQAVTHVPPSGGALTPTITVSGNYVTIKFGPTALAGTHYLDCLIAYDNASGLKKGVRITVTVPNY